MEELRTLFTDKEALKVLKKNFPRIVQAEIKESALYITFYGADNMEIWINDFKNLEDTLKTTFNKFYNDKQYFTKVIRTI